MDSFLEWVVFVGVIYLLFKVINLQEDIKGMKYTLDQMASKMQLPENPINDDLRVLLQEGQDVEAIKIARETLGLSLVEGKEYVDALKSDGDETFN